MAAITTQKISLVFERIVRDYPEINFVSGSDFSWSAKTNRIKYPKIQLLDDIYQLLHEIGHAKLKHLDFPSDIALIEMEMQAWQYATSHLAPIYGLSLTMESRVVDSAMDSYRHWLNERSTCPNCQAIGIEKFKSSYHCLSCQQNWRVNEARQCQLRRYKK